METKQQEFSRLFQALSISRQKEIIQAITTLARESASAAAAKDNQEVTYGSKDKL